MHRLRLKCCCSNRLLLVSRDLTILRAHLLAGYTQDPLVSIAGKEVDAYSLGTDNSQDLLREVIARESENSQ